MKKTIFILVFLTLHLPLWAQTYNFTFETDNEGWLVDYADYPVSSASDSISFYELLNSHSALPLSIIPGQYGIKIRGNNHSDDLFMFLKKKITGLNPNTTYKVNYNIDIASNAPTNAAGVGGSPGEGVVVKAGATIIEPRKVVNAGTYRMNIDKANQDLPGPDMDTVGNIGVDDTTTVYHLIHRNNTTHPFQVTTDATGELWLVIGTESGYEAVTELYYANINVRLDQSVKVSEPDFAREVIIFPNPATGKIRIRINNALKIASYTISDTSGRIWNRGIYSQDIDVHDLSNGMYFISLQTNDGNTVKIFTKQ